MSLTYNALQTFQSSKICQLFTIQPTRSMVYSFLIIYVSVSQHPVSSFLKFCNHSLIYLTPVILGMNFPNFPKMSASSHVPPSLTCQVHNSPPALSPEAFHSWVKTEFFKLSLPVLLLHHTMTPTTNYFHHSTLLSTTLRDLNSPDSDLAQKWIKWPSYCRPENDVAAVTKLFCGTEKFWRFTLHDII